MYIVLKYVHGTSIFQAIILRSCTVVDSIDWCRFYLGMRYEDDTKQKKGKHLLSLPPLHNKHGYHQMSLSELPTHTRGDGLGFGSHHSY